MGIHIQNLVSTIRDAAAKEDLAAIQHILEVFIEDVSNDCTVNFDEMIRILIDNYPAIYLLLQRYTAQEHSWLGLADEPIPIDLEAV